MDIQSTMLLCTVALMVAINENGISSNGNIRIKRFGAMNYLVGPLWLALVGVLVWRLVA
tara:strand:- start:770 stop:946 length:177 start_codon:yes stop_codon:yes gene_type:complete